MKLQLVPARTGIQWAKLGIQAFFKQPLALAGLFFMYMASMLVLMQLPLVGAVLGPMLMPAATLGLMAASAQASEGRFPMPSVLVSAFRAGRERARAMLVLGAMYAAGSLLATLLGALLTDAPPALSSPTPTEAEMAQMNARTFAIMAFHMPLVVLFWHAPALVHWHGVAPAKSLFFSAVACLRNFGAFFMYGVTWAAIFLAIGFVLSTIGLLLGGVAVSRVVMMPTALLLAAMFSTSMYFTFRDSFVATPGDSLDPPPTEKASHE